MVKSVPPGQIVSTFTHNVMLFTEPHGTKLSSVLTRPRGVYTQLVLASSTPEHSTGTLGLIYYLTSTHIGVVRPTPLQDTVI